MEDVGNKLFDKYKEINESGVANNHDARIKLMIVEVLLSQHVFQSELTRENLEELQKIAETKHTQIRWGVIS